MTRGQRLGVILLLILIGMGAGVVLLNMGSDEKRKGYQIPVGQTKTDSFSQGRKDYWSLYTKKDKVNVLFKHADKTRYPDEGACVQAGDAFLATNPYGDYKCEPY